MAAEINGYPGPRHVLDLQDQLGLSEEQVKQVEAIMDAMQEKARAKGEAIIANEEFLERLFRTDAVDETKVRDLSAEIGRLRGELRGIHLSAHLQTAEVLNKEQTETYMNLRHAGQNTPAGGQKHE